MKIGYLHYFNKIFGFCSNYFLFSVSDACFEMLRIENFLLTFSGSSLFLDYFQGISTFHSHQTFTLRTGNIFTLVITTFLGQILQIFSLFSLLLLLFCLGKMCGFVVVYLRRQSTKPVANLSTCCHTRLLQTRAV